MLGVWVNFAVVVLGGALGSIMKTAIPERYARTINNGLALCVIMIGISGALETQSTLLVIVSMVVGTVAGTALKIEERLGQLGDWAQKRFSHGGSRFSALFCLRFFPGRGSRFRRTLCFRGRLLRCCR